MALARGRAGKSGVVCQKIENNVLMQVTGSILGALACSDAPSHSPKNRHVWGVLLSAFPVIPAWIRVRVRVRTGARAVGQADLYNILNIPAVYVLSWPGVGVTARTLDS